MQVHHFVNDTIADSFYLSFLFFFNQGYTHRSTHTSDQRRLIRTDLTAEGQMDVHAYEIRHMKLTRTLTGKKHITINRCP